MLSCFGLRTGIHIFSYHEYLNITCVDCVKCQLRKCIETELAEYIIGLVCSLRYLCPLKSQYHALVVAPAKEIERQNEIAQKGAAAAILKIKSEKKVEGKKSVDNDKGSELTLNSAARKTEKKKDLTAFLAEPLELDTDTRLQKRFHSCLSEFEGPRFGLSTSAWELMLISSLSLESTFAEILEDVPLDVSVLFEEE